MARRRPRSSIPSRLSVDADPRKPEAVALGETIRDWLATRSALADGLDDADMVVVLGGDGSVVRAARMARDKPILGVDFGHFGFLTHVPPARWERRLRQVLDGRYLVRDDPTLRVVVERGPERIGTLWAVQDVVFHAYVVPGNGQQMALLELFIEGRYVNPIPGDGLIISTGPGSSAYNLAAGGTVLTPGSDAYSVAPIAPHTPMRTNFVIPTQTSITVVQKGRFPVNICVDGQETLDEFAHGDVAHISADPRRFRLVTFPDITFYDRFRQRFNFRIRPGRVAPTEHHEHI